MFFEGSRIDAMREMILAESLEERRAALAKLLPYQREDFVGIFKELKGLSATIRLLDPPLHGFLPHTEAQQKDLAQKLGVSPDKISRRVHQLHEFNPMLGHRGCRLGISFPEITGMQARAIFEAAAHRDVALRADARVSDSADSIGPLDAMRLCGPPRRTLRWQMSMLA